MNIKFGNIIKEYKDNFYLCTQERMVENKCFDIYWEKDMDDNIVYIDDTKYHNISNPFIRRVDKKYFDLIEYNK